MRILHVPYSFFPDPPGGTEIYVNSLAIRQQLIGLDAMVAAPGRETARYQHGNTPVWRFGSASQVSLEELYGEGEPAAAESFGRILDESHPDLVHIHALTSAVSVRLADQAIQRRIPIVFNYHTPTVSCARGTLLRGGTEICDGGLHASRCTVCSLQGKGIATPAASLINAAGPLFARSERSGGIWTALRIPHLTRLRIGMFHRMMQKADRVVALCNWTRDLLLRNDVPESKITLCRQGIDWAPATAAAERAPHAPLRFAFLGRFDATKGAEILLRALRKSDFPFQLDLYGVRQGDSGSRYADQLHAEIGTDARFRIQPALAPADVIPALRNYDALVVPSQWLETGPLVVLEAFAAGIPVIGSKLGGIAELVTDQRDGLLVTPYDSVAAWTSAFGRVIGQPELLDAWRRNIRPPRHTRQVAVEFLSLYEQLVRR